MPAWSSRREQRPGDMIVRRRFLFLPPVVGSNRFCNLRHASKGFFRELATIARFAHRAVHERCVHLLQHKLQVWYSSLRRSRQEFTIDELCRDFRRLFSSPLLTSSPTP